MYPIYIRGLAYLAIGKATEAAAEFSRLLAHPGLHAGDPVDARLGGNWQGRWNWREIGQNQNPPTSIFLEIGKTPIQTSRFSRKRRRNTAT